jgi:uncharacterized ion transporter superfamily protein YfcC
MLAPMAMPRRFPDALTFLLGCLIVATVLTYAVPAGQYDRRDDPVTGRKVVVPNTYHRVAAAPVSPFDAVVAVPKGIEDASAVIAFVLLVGAGLTVVDKTGVLREGADWLINSLKGREAIIVPIISIGFAMGGVVEGMMEEVIALVPLMVIVTQRLGYPPVIAVAMSLGAAGIGDALSPMNPFIVGIAQKVSGVPLLSGWQFRIALLVPALAIWIWWTLRIARRHRTHDAAAATHTAVRLSPRAMVLLLLVIVAVAVYLVGVIRLGWDFEQMASIFLLLGIVAGLVGGLGIAGTADAFAEGLRGMVYSGVLIGFARAIYLVLDQAHIIDTIVYALFVPLQSFPRIVAALGMLAAQTALHVPVPSTSGQAVLSLPILVPLSDLMGFSAQVTVLAYQCAAGFCDLLTPTNGALMAVLAAAKVSYDEWLKFFLPAYAVLLLLATIALAVAIFIGYA